MANKLISEMGLPKSIANVFSARNILTAKDASSLSEFELMELMDVGLEEVMAAVLRISEISCPPYQTALSLLEQRNHNEYLAGHLPTGLIGLDEALCGGIPFGVVTEFVGPSGIGKTRFCLKLALLASLPTSHGGLGGRVIYIDVESKFSSRRHGSTGRILVLQPASLSEFTESLQKLKVSLLQHDVKLLIIDSMTALPSGEYGQGPPKLGWHISFIKSLAECCRIPVVVTNQVRSQVRDEASRYVFQGHVRADTLEDTSKVEYHLVAALGIHWAHAVSIHLVLESRSGKRLIKIAKSSISPSLGFFFRIDASGISFLNNEGEEMTGPEANSIHCQGQSGIINYGHEALQ
ncbi:DNA repair protein RAD51 homolog 2-like [Salvia splendens]|uniref:DNA repair protein RAD51 homolog 2-like n=1 Tax=Salvia splendens TaxID=180675 RepID=UPI001C260F7A|nr:DNA repair protein RAD51 homolog 2-like [Salvia splendens]